MLGSPCGFRAALTLVAGLGLLFPATRAAHGAEVTVADVFKAWKERTNRVRTFRFKWDEQYTVSKGLYKSPGERGNPGDVYLPPKTTTYDTSYSVTMDGEKLRYDYDEIEGAGGKLINQKGNRVVAGGEFKGFRGPGASRYPQGIVAQPVPGEPYGTDPQIQPLLLLFRPLNTGSIAFKNFPNQFSEVPGRSVIDERSCVQLKEGARTRGQLVTTVWVDPERDFVVTRVVLSDDERPHAQWTFHDFIQTEHGWVPRKWTRTFLGRSGSVLSSASATVRDFELNRPVDPNEFEVEFPPGTWVTDMRGKEEVQYIVKEGGERRLILREERVGGATYEQFLTTETGRALEQPQKDRGRRVLGTALAAAVVVVVFVVARRSWRRKAGGPSGAV
jgi:hypothetical protein